MDDWLAPAFISAERQVEMRITNAKLLKGSEKILYVGLSVVFRVDVKISDSLPVAIKIGSAVATCIVDEVFPVPGVILDGEFVLGEMAFAGKPHDKLLVQVCPVVNGYLQGSVKKRPGVNGAVKAHASQLSDGARLLIHE